MTSHVLASIFGPAAALVGRMRYARKFVVVGLVLLIPLGFVATAYVDLQHSQLDFSAKERDGVDVMRPLIALTAATVQARHEALGTGRPTPVDRDIAAVDAVADGVGRKLAMAGSWRTTRQLVLGAQHGTGTPQARFEAFNTA